MAAREVLEGGNVKGGMLRSHLQWAWENRADLSVDDLARRVSPATAAIVVARILPVAWYPFRAVVEVDRAIAEAVGGDAADVVRELGRHSARVNLGTSYKVYTRPEPHEFFESAARLHQQFMDFGRAVYERTGASSCRLAMDSYPCYSPVFCLSAAGYYEQATVLQGPARAEVRELECQCTGDARCLFDIRWW